MNTIQEQWGDFRKNVVPISAPDIQVSEMQKAFYAGAYASIMVMIKISAEDVSEDAGVQIFETLKNECESFGLTGG